MEARSRYTRNIRKGREPPMHAGIDERFFRVGGTASDVTELSLKRYGRNMVPIFNKVSEKRWYLTQQYANEEKYPALWAVRRFSAIKDWENLFENYEDGIWYLQTRAKKKILYMEADATNVEDALSLGKPSNDLSVRQASQSFRILEMFAHTKLSVPPDEVVRVFLADVNQKVEIGGDKEITLGDYIEETKEADIVVDATAPLLEKILDWCEKVESSPSAEELYEEKGWFQFGGQKEDFKKTILFDTNDKEDFQIVSTLLGSYGYRLIDRGSVDSAESFDFPRLIYRDSSADTLSLLHTLVTRRLAQPSKCCILVDSSKIHVELDYIRRHLNPHVSKD
eukprot:CAMPEP_0167767110 /NCGR_PEP_ID=MMETSP0110_2-20121227/15822_1 /TAXON_ID=629695 /ORGANISM="Gymnochlora sp., Strain CCMP2014" /LENGTH=337 /DNA_ID=CAMNT_0007655421 /DNA_START=6 /DNA_END=1016 /DNA_ORIENTATION=-